MRRIAWVSVFAIALGGVPVQVAATPPDPITWDDGICDLEHRGRGLGNAVDPFQIGTQEELAELRDCSEREFDISQVEVTLGSRTARFESDNHGLAVGHLVSVLQVPGSEPAGFEVFNASVTEVGEADDGVDYFSVQYPSAFSSNEIFSPISGVLKASIEMDYYQLVSNIVLNDIEGCGLLAPLDEFVEREEFNDTRGDGWIPIGTGKFTFDGNGHEICGLTIHDSISDAGLFGYISNANIHDLTISHASVNVSSDVVDNAECAGVLFGCAANVNIVDVHVEYSEVIGGLSYVGLMGGGLLEGSVENVSTSGSVSAESLAEVDLLTPSLQRTRFGGLFGSAENTVITDAHSEADVDSSITVWFDPNDEGATLEGIGGRYVGGLIGQAINLQIVDSSADGDVVGRTVVGGLIGLFGESFGFGPPVCGTDDSLAIEYDGPDSIFLCPTNGSLHNVTASGDVAAEVDFMFDVENEFVRVGHVGGLVGAYLSDGDISDASATGDVRLDFFEPSLGSAYSDVYVGWLGGFIGVHGGAGAVSDSESEGSVTLSIEDGCSLPIEDGCSPYIDLIHVNSVGGFFGLRESSGANRAVQASGDVFVDYSLDFCPLPPVEEICDDDGVAFINNIGGFVGYSGNNGAYTDARAIGDVSVSIGVLVAAEIYDIGGFVGESEESVSYVNVHAEGDVETNRNGSDVGGFAGDTEEHSVFIDSSSSGNVTVELDYFPSGESNAEVGGFIGSADGPTSVMRSSSRGDVTIEGSPETDAIGVGGFIGHSEDGLMITDSYTRSNIEVSGGAIEVGGLVGSISSGPVLMQRVYVASTVDATPSVGREADAQIAAVANGVYTSSVGTNVYNSDLADDLGNTANFLGKTTAEMNTRTTFSGLGWDISGDDSVWMMSATQNDGYPYLRSRGRSDDDASPPSDSGSGGGGPAPSPAPSTRPSTPSATPSSSLPPNAPRSADPGCSNSVQLRISFVDGSSVVSSSSLSRISSFVTRVKRANCERVTLTAPYVKNIALARARNRALASLLREEFWRQRHVVRFGLAELQMTDTSRGLRTVLLSGER